MGRDPSGTRRGDSSAGRAGTRAPRSAEDGARERDSRCGPSWKNVDRDQEDRRNDRQDQYRSRRSLRRVAHAGTETAARLHPSGGADMSGSAGVWSGGVAVAHWVSSPWLSVSILSVVRGGQEDDGLLVVDLVEDPPASDPDPPRRRGPVAQPRRRRNASRRRTENRVDPIFESRPDPSRGRSPQAIEVSTVALRFEQPVFRQTGPGARRRPGAQL